jgi:hypothetical protein
MFTTVHTNTLTHNQHINVFVFVYLYYTFITNRLLYLVLIVSNDLFIHYQAIVFNLYYTIYYFIIRLSILVDTSRNQS